MMTDAGTAISCARPVIACHCARKRLAIRTRSREDVVGVGIVSTAIHLRPFFGKRVLFTKFVLVAVQVVDILRNNNAFRVLPGTLADAIPSVHSRLISRSGCAQVCPPGFAACSCRCCELLTDRVCAGQAPRFAPLPDPALVMKKLIFGVVCESATFGIAKIKISTKQ